MLMRKEKNKNFTLVDNYMINDLKITPSNKGVLLFMLSKPDNWNFNFECLQKGLGIGNKAVRSNLNSLENAKYLKRIRSKDIKGQWQWEYYIYDIPYDLEINKENNPYIPQGHVDEGHIPEGNIYKYYNKEIDKLDKDKNEFSIYTQDLLKRGYIDINEYNLNYYDNLFFDCLNKGYDKYDLLKSINYICNRVKSNNYTDENGFKIENKFGYFKKSLIDSLERNNRVIEDKYQETGDILDWNWLESDDRER